MGASSFNVIEIITLASIIQGEAQLEDEMPIISSVYNNRIKRRMKLEADPTVLYYMDDKDLQMFKNFSGENFVFVWMTILIIFGLFGSGHDKVS